jgi:hypothetical protein
MPKGVMVGWRDGLSYLSFIFVMNYVLFVACKTLCEHGNLCGWCVVFKTLLFIYAL